MKNIRLKTLGAVCIITGSLLIPVAAQVATIEDLSNDLVDLEKNYHLDIKERANRLEAGVIL